MYNKKTSQYYIGFFFLTLLFNVFSVFGIDDTYLYQSDPLYLESISDVVFPTKDLKINEILASNVSVNKDEYGEYDDWIELYNFGDDTINLNGLYISDSKNNLTKFQINFDTLLLPQSYIIIWADEETEQGPLHTNFKLDGLSEKVYISNENLEILDFIEYSTQATDISYGRLKDNFLIWNYFTSPTPNSENPATGSLQILNPPASNQKAGFYDSTICVVLHHSDPSAEIFYTLNGDVPTQSSYNYHGCIEINNTTVLRYRAFKNNYIPSSIQTKTFFYDLGHNMDIIALTAPGQQLVGDNGVFKSTATDVEKTAHVEFFGSDKKLKFKLDAGLRLHSPKSNRQYSMRIYARSDYGFDNIDYPVFRNKNILNYKRLILRNSGNDGTVLGTRYLIHFRDALHHILFQEMNPENLMSSYKPVNVFLNGQYFGIYNLRERIDKYYIESNLGYTGEMDLLERAFKYPGNKYAIEGSFVDYLAVENYAELNDLKIDTSYNHVKDIVDIDNFIDYWIHEVYVGNFDWFVNNIKIFRPLNPDGKFKWLLWDTDHGSGLPYMSYGDVNWKTLTWSLGTDNPRTTNGSTNKLHRNLIENDAFRTKFVNRFADLLNTVYQYEHMEKVIDSVKHILDHDMVYHYEKWNINKSYWDEGIDYVKNYYEFRPNVILKDILDCMAIDTFYTVTIQTNDQSYGTVKINTITPEFNNNLWEGIYFDSITINIEAIPNEGYRFDRWANLPDFEENNHEVLITKDQVIEAVFAPIGIDSSKIIINEISYVNFGDKSDWIEILNKTGVDMNMNGWKLVISDDTLYIPDITVQNNICALFSGEENEHLKIEKDIEIVRYDDFEINNLGDHIKLLDTNNNLIDDVSFAISPPWPLLSNGYGFTLELISGYQDNAKPQSWIASTFLGGSPGKQNYISNDNLSSLRINEIMTNNNYIVHDEWGEFDDWIELYNFGDKAVDIRGLFISDDNNYQKYQIPYVEESLILKPDSFLIIWADNDEDQGPLHSNFKLSSKGEQLSLHYNDGYEIIKIDNITFEQQFPGFSYGREYDGVNEWILLSPTPGRSNLTDITLTDESFTKKEIFFPYNIYPNPVNDYLIIETENDGNNKIKLIEVYDIMGVKYTVQSLENQGKFYKLYTQNLNPGVYVIKIRDDNGQVYTKKIFKNNSR